MCADPVTSVPPSYVASSHRTITGESSTTKSVSVDPSSQLLPATVRGSPSAQVFGKIIGAVVVVVLVVGLVTVVAASLIAWKVRSGEKTSIGMNWALVHVRFVWCVLM